ncbi:hypothetical protein ONG05_000885 [Vibrio parahaemolyticus]|nr:hypothetical protein [Vibrio parahaemolyticus]
MGQSLSDSRAFWLQRINHFRCSSINAPYRGFTYVHHADYLALTRFCGYQEDRLLTI